MHSYMYAYITATTHTTYNITSFKAIKDIEAGQEIFIRYGSARWFEIRSIPYADVDYASTMWRPDLQPLPCRQSVAQSTGADGRHSFFVREAIPADTVLEVSLCVEVPVDIVDQIPSLKDFVLTGEMETEPTAFKQIFAPSCTHTACVFADQDEAYDEDLAEQVLCFLSPLTLNQRPYTL